MNPTVRVQSAPMRSVGAAAVALPVVLVVGLVLSGAWAHLARFGGPLGLLALVGVAAFWMPYVEVSDGGVEVRNVLRTVRLPWPAVRGLDGRLGLRIDSAYGPVTAWAATAPSGAERLAGADSEAAAAVRERLELLRAEGHLDDPRLEVDRLPVTWHAGVLALAAALVALTTVGWLLA